MIADKLNRKDYFFSKEVPKLVDFAVSTVALNFSLYPHLKGLTNQKLIEQVIESTPLNLALTISAPYIHQESYWKKACEKRWKNARPDEHGWSWKQTYLEKHIQEAIGKFPPNADSTYLLEQIIAASPWLFTLFIDQLPSHISLRDLFRHVPVLSKLTVTYGAKHLGSEYERSLFGMTMDDAASLAKLIKNASNLIYLSLPCNMIDDDLVKMLCRGFLLSKTMIELDLSHNRIGDHGARRLAKYLFHDETLQILDLSDNQIQYDGSRCIGQALRNNSSLSVLNLKHNRLDDKSGAKLCNDLQHNHSVKVLNLSSNQMSTLFCEKLAEILKEDKMASITELDISCNRLVDPNAEDIIVEEMIETVNNLKNTLHSRCVLSKFDIRNNNIPRALEKEINEIVLKTEMDRKQIPLYQSEALPSSDNSRASSRGSQASNGRNRK